MDALNRLVDALRCLPGVGPKSARRMVYHLLLHQRPRGLHLADCLREAMQKLGHCVRCNNYTEHDLCTICQNPARDLTTLCVVESPSDVLAIEQSHAFGGGYFVLMGKISPLDGLTADDIGLPRLQHLVVSEQINEVILALSPTVEGQITNHCIRDLFREHPVQITQLAHGIPAGGELEFLDGITIGSALRNRAVMHD